MSHHGYTYGPPEGYYHPPPETTLPQPAHLPLAHSNPANAAVASGPSNTSTSRQAFDNTRSVIPGLGLAFSNGASGWQQPSAGGPATSTEADKASEETGRESTDNWHRAQAAASQSRPAKEHDKSEDGEVSEGELEDIYEPRYSGEQDTPYSDNQADRMGSYSPYLSPHEIEQNDAADSDALHAVATQPQPLPPTEAKTIIQARKQAQDSILRLWPLNVRYQDYLEEGIDAAILQGLFCDLGLDVGAVSSRPSQARNSPPSQPSIQQPETSTAPAETRDEASAADKTPEKKSAKNPAEERKDRIARLLAAKGSKQAITASDQPPRSSPAVSAPSPTPKAQSEKSKLLQQKMEALKKAREARIQTSGSLGPQGHEDLHRAEDDTTNTPITKPPASQDQTEEGKQDTDVQPPSIPSRPLSPKPPPASQNKRPVAADLNDASEVPSKRPFGHARQSQPFLIDVSDDDDDEAMDLDSPELRPASASRPRSPAMMTLARDSQGGRDDRSRRGQPSPSTVPPATYGGKANLESMNKEIEAMKRRIAEAEARKKGKLSGESSPATDLAYPRSAASGSPAVSSPGSDYQEAAIRGSSNEPSQRLPKASERRRPENRSTRSRSRAASERLPIIEAHRREQLLKLQALQSQVKRMEKEIQESLEEEERLRKETDDRSLSDDEEMDVASPNHAFEQQGSDPSHATTASLNGTQQWLGEAAHTTQSVGYEGAHSVEQSEAQDTVPPGDSTLSGINHADTQEPNDAKPENSVERSAGPVDGDEPMDEREDAGPAAERQAESGEASDGYEPPEAELSTPDEDGAESEPAPSPAAADDVADGSHQFQDVTATAPITQPISIGQQESRPGSREGQLPSQTQETAPRSGFIPYESPLKYFRAYRFHPTFQHAVPGGMRSLTYSNKIDVKKELCPDQLAGAVCPRGDQCDYQHFESMQAPDDQILLQLGGYGNYEGKQKQEYINGLRNLLTDFRNRKIKDFATISQGIVDYRAQFLKDPTKVLPLGDVSL